LEEEEEKRRIRRFCTEEMFSVFSSFLISCYKFKTSSSPPPPRTKGSSRREREGERASEREGAPHRKSIVSAAAASAAASFLSFSLATSSSLPTTSPVPEQLKHACRPFPAHRGHSVHLAARGAAKGCQRTALRPRQTQQRRLPGVEEEVAEEEEVKLELQSQQLLQGTNLLRCRALTATRITAEVAVETASVAEPSASSVPPKPTRARKAAERIGVFFDDSKKKTEKWKKEIHFTSKKNSISISLRAAACYPFPTFSRSPAAATPRDTSPDT
jgi:hypothetical protein